MPEDDGERWPKTNISQIGCNTFTALGTFRPSEFYLHRRKCDSISGICFFFFFYEKARGYIRELWAIGVSFYSLY